ncbi:MAG: hypothetical protein HZB35_01040 [Nitrospirae bacterium]|nr:hypothetical protein [Nitrospirota bacterium]
MTYLRQVQLSRRAKQVSEQAYPSPHRPAHAFAQAARFMDFLDGASGDEEPNADLAINLARLSTV